jgi:hypothetical protein
MSKQQRYWQRLKRPLDQPKQGFASGFARQLGRGASGFTRQLKSRKPCISGMVNSSLATRAPQVVTPQKMLLVLSFSIVPSRALNAAIFTAGGESYTLRSCTSTEHARRSYLRGFRSANNPKLLMRLQFVHRVIH